MIRQQNRTKGQASRIYCIIGGAVIASVLSAEWFDSGSRSTPYFRIAVSYHGKLEFVNRILSTIPPLHISIYMIDDHLKIENLVFDGLADQVTVNKIEKTAQFQGRDHSVIFLENSLNYSFLNQTASEIAYSIASRHEFETEITSTTNLIGSYRGGDFTQIVQASHSKISNEWLLLRQLAELEGYEVFLRKKKLIFAPESLIEKKYHTIGVDDLIELKISRAMTSVGNVTAAVKTWNSWLNQGYGSYGGEADNLDEAQDGLVSARQSDEFTIVTPNLSSSLTNELSRTIQRTMEGSDLTVLVLMPGETIMNTFDVVTVYDPVTKEASTFTISSIRRRFSPTLGFLQRIRGVMTTDLAVL